MTHSKFRSPLFVLTLALAMPALAVLGATARPAVAVAGEGEAEGEAMTVDVLMEGFATMPGLYADFRQEVHFGMLARPLVDEGTLHFSDGRLARRTLVPALSVVVIDADGIEFGDSKGSERIDLDGKPAVRQFVDAFTMIFAGDRGGLERLYRIEFVPGEGRTWTMNLIPKVSPMDKVIDRVEVSGVDLAITKMRVLEHGGDETVTSFSKVDTARRYTAAEKAHLFSVN